MKKSGSEKIIIIRKIFSSEKILRMIMHIRSSEKFFNPSRYTGGYIYIYVCIYIISEISNEADVGLNVF